MWVKITESRNLMMFALSSLGVKHKHIDAYFGMKEGCSRRLKTKLRKERPDKDRFEWAIMHHLPDGCDPVAIGHALRCFYIELYNKPPEEI
jgi:hypothetical protein